MGTGAGESEMVGGFDVDLTVDLDISQDYDDDLSHPPLPPPPSVISYDQNHHHHHAGGGVAVDRGGIPQVVGMVHPSGRPSYPPGLVRRGK